MKKFNTNIVFKVVKKMRIVNGEPYPDLGDYYEKNGKVYIVALDTGNNKYNMSILLHEFIEYLFIKAKGIDPKLIDNLDTLKGLNWVKKRPKEYRFYRKMHKFAISIEKKFIKTLKLNWNKYDKYLEKL